MHTEVLNNMKTTMKAGLAFIAALSMAACSSGEPAGTSSTPTPEAAAETGTGVYTFWNTTGEKVTELYVYDNSGSDKGENYAGDGLRNGRSVEVTKADVPADASFTIEFTTESGYKGSFPTLHVEETAINLPAEDALTGATQIAFGEPNLKAEYVLYNQTGENVTDLYLYEEGADKGDNLAGDGLADGKSVTVSYELPASETADKVYHVEFKTEGGLEGEFTTLHYEEAPISLLAEDARTGATQISFTSPDATSEYTIYNTTGETVTELYLYENGSEDKGENFAEGGLTNGSVVGLGETASAYSVRNKEYTLEFKTESGYEAAFTTLHFEKAPISLLAEDAMTGATPIAFKAAE